MMKALLLWTLFMFSGVDFEIAPIKHPARVSADDDIPHYTIVNGAASLENRGLICMAFAVYKEARGESWFGQALVAQVVLNRQVEMGTGADACDVIAEAGQFQWNDTWTYPRRPWLEDRRAWDMALDVANAVITGDYYVPPPCNVATHFRTHTAPAPAWTDLKLVCSLGGHDFYTQNTLAVVATADGQTHSP